MNDKPDFPTTLRDLEISCYNFQKNPSRRTHEGIDEFKNSRHIIPAAKYVLEHSKKPEVHFHALAGLKEAVLKRWNHLTPDEVILLRNNLFDYVSRHPDLPPFLKGQVYKTLSAIIKRGWIDMDFKATTELFQRIEAFLTAGSIYEREIGIDFCAQLVSEFSFAGAQLDLPWKFHVESKQSFQQKYLQQVFAYGLKTVEQILVLKEEDRKGVMGLFKRCLELIEKVFSWPFKDNESSQNSTSFEPEESWRQMLVQNIELLQIYFKMYFVCIKDETLLPVVTQILIQLASLTGPVFENPSQKLGYLQYFAQGIFHIMFLPNHTASPSEVLNIAQILSRFALHFPTNDNPKPFFDNLTKFTCSVLGQLQRASENDRDPYLNAIEELLEAWVFFVGGNLPVDSSRAQFLQEYCGTIFRCYTEARLAVARNELNSIGDGAIIPKDSKNYSDQLMAVARLGRMDIVKCTLNLNNLLHERLRTCTMTVQQMANGQNQFPQETLEEMHWLVLIAGHLLADDPKGETELSVPPTISESSIMCIQHKRPDPFIEIITTIFKIIEFENMCVSNDKIGIWSPLLAETLIWFMNRWSQSYLCLSGNVSPTLIAAYGGNDGNRVNSKIIDFFMFKITTNLLKWSDKELAKETCNMLLGLSKLRIPTQQLMQCKSWVELLTAYALGDKRLIDLPGSVQRCLICALVRMQISTDFPQKAQYFTDIVKSVRETLVSLLNNNEFQAKYSQPAIMKTVNDQLERTRGIIRACNQYTADLVWEFCSLFLKPFIGFFRIYKNSHEVVQLLLGLWLDMAKHIAVTLSNENKELFLQATMDFFVAYHELGFGKPRKRRQSEQQVDEQQATVTRALRICLEISKLNHPRSARTSYYGISVIITAVGVELLTFPKLAENYYSVVHSLFKNHTDKLPVIPLELFIGLLNSISAALAQRFEVSHLNCCLESLQFMLSYHLQVRYNERRDAFDQDRKNHIGSFLNKMLDFFLCGDVFKTEITALACDVFFALIWFDVQLYQNVVKNLINEAGPDKAIQVAKLFTNLQTEIDMRAEFEPNNRNLFSRNFQTFLPEYRVLLKKK